MAAASSFPIVMNTVARAGRPRAITSTLAPWSPAAGSDMEAATTLAPRRAVIGGACGLHGMSCRTPDPEWNRCHVSSQWITTPHGSSPTAISAIFVAQFFGLDLSITDYVLIAFVSVIGSGMKRR